VDDLIDSSLLGLLEKLGHMADVLSFVCVRTTSSFLANFVNKGQAPCPLSFGFRHNWNPDRDSVLPLGELVSSW
jgi:hypothetical protein